MSLRYVLRLIVATTFVAALFAPTEAAAQGAAVGAKVGLNVSNVSFEDNAFFNPPTESANGMLLGVTFRKDFNRIAGIQIEGNYAQAGTNITDSDGIDTFRLELRLHEIQIPVLFTVAAMSNDTSSVHLFAGPTFGFKAGDSNKQFFNGTEFPLEEGDVDIKTNDTGITFGGLIGIKKFFIDVRYTIGLTNINGDVDNDPEEPNVKTRQFAIAFGYYFKGR